MKGVIFEQMGRAVVSDEIERPVCGDDQVLIHTIWSGITNGTERNFLMGGNYCPGFPNRAGYQIVGEVAAKGRTVDGYAVGDVVYCGHFLGHLEYVAVPAAEDNLVVKLDEGIKPEEAALFGVASVALHDCRQARVTPGHNVLVVGLGVIGQFTLQHGLAMGADVAASDPDPDRRRIAGENGRGTCIDPSTEEGRKKLESSGPYDTIFEDSGADVLAGLVPLLRHRGTLVLVAGRREVGYPFNAACRREITVLHVNHFTKDDVRSVMDLVRTGKVRVSPLIKDIFRIGDAERAYGIMRDDPSRLLGTVFDWR